MTELEKARQALAEAEAAAAAATDAYYAAGPADEAAAGRRMDEADRAVLTAQVELNRIDPEVHRLYREVREMERRSAREQMGY